MDKDVAYYLGLPYTRRVEPRDDDGLYWVAWIEELPACVVDDDSMIGALSKLHDTLRDFIEAMLEHGPEIPEPPLWVGIVQDAVFMPDEVAGPEFSFCALRAGDEHQWENSTGGLVGV